MRNRGLVTIGHSAVVHACDIEDECLIGNRTATILDGAAIGALTIVGANALVTGTQIPPGSLVLGSPAVAPHRG